MKWEHDPKRVLIISPAGLPELHAILIDLGWAVRVVHNRPEALLFLCSDRVPIIISEIQFPGGEWKDILSYTSGIIPAPKLVVTCRETDEHLQAEVINLGGYDVLAEPFRCEEVAYVSDAALRNWRQQHQPRPTLLYRTA